MKFSDLYIALGFKDDKFKRGIKQSQSHLKGFSASVGKLGGVIAGAFAAEKLLRFGSELVTLGGKAQGVRTAFDQLDKPSLLDDLRKATRGTVDDLTLMQKAVQAKNFKIPLSQLATYFEFATKRAIQTGESVDYLVNSIITGIGRKSVLVMDNLGISAVELQEEVKKVGDFGVAAGNIIQRELTGMGDVVNTAVTETERLSAEWLNFKIFLGEQLTPAVKNFLSEMNNVFSVMKNINKSDSISFWDKLNLTISQGNAKVATKIALRVAEEEKLNKLQAEAIEMRDKLLGKDKEINQETTVLIPLYQKLNDELEKYKELAEQATTEGQLTLYQRKIALLEIELKKLKELGKARTDLDKMEPVSKMGKLGTSQFETTSDLPTLIPLRESDIELFDARAAEIEARTEQFKEFMQYAFMEMGEAMGQLFQAEANPQAFFESILKVLGTFVKEFGATMISIGLALQTSLLFAAQGTMAIISGMILIGVGTALQSIKLADGGLVYGPTTALIGEYSGARSNPEVVAPLDKLQSMLSGNGNEMLTTRVSGEDLLIILDRTNKRRSTVR